MYINKSEFEKINKLQSEVYDSKNSCRTDSEWNMADSEWNMAKVFINKDLLRLGYELDCYDLVIKRSN
jgi:hypothetical protein